MTSHGKLGVLRTPLLLIVLGWSGLWLILSGAALDSWLIGAPSVAFATWISLRLMAPHSPQRESHRLSLKQIPAFALFFLWESLLGGVDVAKRAIPRRPDLAPGFIHFDTRIPASPARLLFISCISLMPGTLAARLNGQRIIIHTLNTSGDNDAALKKLEIQVLKLFPRLQECAR